MQEVVIADVATIWLTGAIPPGVHREQQTVGILFQHQWHSFQVVAQRTAATSVVFYPGVFLCDLHVVVLIRLGVTVNDDEGGQVHSFLLKDRNLCQCASP